MAASTGSSSARVSTWESSSREHNIGTEQDQASPCGHAVSNYVPPGMIFPGSSYHLRSSKPQPAAHRAPAFDERTYRDFISCVRTTEVIDTEQVFTAHHQDDTVRAAIDSGITLIDTARGYQTSEETIGKALKGGYRDRCFLATKVSGDFSGKGIVSSMEDSLKALDIDHVDLYQIHRWDPEYPMDESMEVLARLQAEGNPLYRCLQL